MSATTQTTDASTSSATTGRRSLRWATVVVGLAAAAVTTAVAAALHAAGVSFDVDGEMIPLVAFAEVTFVAALIGGVLLAALNRWSSHPRRRFLESTITLTVLSCLPSAALPDDGATKIALVALHLLAAAIIVPMLARDAHD